MTRVVVVGDLMTDTVAHAALPLAKGSDTPATVSMHGGGSGANVAAWLAADGGGGRLRRPPRRRHRRAQPGHGADGLRGGRPARHGPGPADRHLRGDGDPQGRPHHAVRPGSQCRAAPRRPAQGPVRTRDAPAYVRVHAAERGIPGRGPGRLRPRGPGGHDDLDRRRLGRSAGAGRGRAVPGDDQRGDPAAGQRGPGHGAHRPGGPRVRRPGAHRLVPAGRGQTGRATGRCTPTAARTRSGPWPCRSRRSWTAPGPGTRSAPGSCRPGWTRSRRWRHWAAAAGWPRARSEWSVPGPLSEPSPGDSSPGQPVPPPPVPPPPGPRSADPGPPGPRPPGSGPPVGGRAGRLPGRALLPGRPGSPGHRRQFRDRPRHGTGPGPGGRPGGPAGPRRAGAGRGRGGHPVGGRAGRWVRADLADRHAAGRDGADRSAGTGSRTSW